MYTIIFQDDRGNAWQNDGQAEGPWLPPKAKPVWGMAAGPNGILPTNEIDPIKRAAAEAMLTYCCHDLGVKVRPALFFEKGNGRRFGVYSAVDHSIRIAHNIPLRENLYTTAHETHHARFAREGADRDYLEQAANAYTEKIKQTTAVMITDSGFVQVQRARPANVKQIRIYYFR